MDSSAHSENIKKEMKCHKHTRYACQKGSIFDLLTYNCLTFKEPKYLVYCAYYLMAQAQKPVFVQ
jgi:hypothetical protein